MPIVESGATKPPISFERAADLMAMWLARFRDESVEPPEPTENERLMASHLAGALWANDLLNTAGETWITVEAET